MYQLHSNVLTLVAKHRTTVKMSQIRIVKKSTSSGFWQMELASSDLTTFMTPFGRFRWNRVPFGLNNAPEMFKRKMVQIFGDIMGVEIYFDDMAIAGENEDEHDIILSQVMKRARKECKI